MSEIPLKIGDRCKYYNGTKWLQGRIENDSSGCFYVQFDHDIWPHLPPCNNTWIFKREIFPCNIDCPEYFKE